MPPRLIWNDHGRAQLQRLHPVPKRLIRRALRDFESLWREQTKPLKGHPRRYTASVGDYRIILRDAERGHGYEIELIAHRSEVYRDYPMFEQADS